MIAVTEPCCCDRCGIELPERNANYPDTGSWHDARLCRWCYFETTNTKVKKRIKPRRGNIPIRAMTILKRIGKSTAKHAPYPD